MKNPTSHYRKWTPEEVTYIRDSYQQFSNKKLGRCLNRTEAAIGAKLTELRVPRRQPFKPKSNLPLAKRTESPTLGRFHFYGRPNWLQRFFMRLIMGARWIG